MINLKGQVCVVVGASSGIGQQIAVDLAECGASVVCTARRKENLDETVRIIQENNGIVEAYTCDFREVAQVEAFTNAVVEKYQAIHLWVNMAGINDALGLTWEIDPDLWLKEIEGNLTTCFLGTRYAVAQMVKQGFGKVINTSGGGSTSAGPFFSAYSCAKTAVVRFTESVAKELESTKDSVQVFAIDPGLVNTKRNQVMAEWPMAKKYFPGLGENLVNENATDIKKSGEFIAVIASGKLDGYTGRLLSVSMDYYYLVEKADEILADDTLLLRWKDL